jgi:hypothetical protein
MSQVFSREPRTHQPEVVVAQDARLIRLVRCARPRYTALLDRLDSVPMAELVMAIRRTSPGFTRGSSSFRGVTQHKSGAASRV